MSRMGSVLGLVIAGAMLNSPHTIERWRRPLKQRTTPFRNKPTLRRIKVKLARKAKLKNQKR